MSYDLTLRTARGTILSPIAGRELLDAFRRETGLDGPCEITAFELEPSALDANCVEAGFESGEFSRGEFTSFCNERDLRPDLDKEHFSVAAQQFLAARDGQELMSIALPPAKLVQAVRDAYRLVVDFARRHDLVLDDPQIGQNIDTQNPGEFPPMWKSAPTTLPPKRRWFSW